MNLATAQQRAWLAAALLLAASAQAVADGKKEPAKELGGLTLEYAPEEGLHLRLESDTGITGLQQKIEALATKHQEQAEVLRQLTVKLDRAATREEVHSLLHETLKSLDQRWAKLVKTIEEKNEVTQKVESGLKVIQEQTRQSQEHLGSLSVQLKGTSEAILSIDERLNQTTNELELSQSEVRELTKRIDSSIEDRAQLVEALEARTNKLHADLQATRVQNSARLAGVESRYRRIESDVASIREMYPRDTPHQQAAQLGISGMRALEKRNYAEALKAFRFGHATDESDPGQLYGMAIALKHLGQSEESEIQIAKAIVAERRRPLGDWYLTCLERLQGPDRFWLSERKGDAFYGVKSPGNLGARVVENN